MELYNAVCLVEAVKIGNRCEVYQLVNLPSLNYPPTMGFDRVVHGIRGKINLIGP